MHPYVLGIIWALGRYVDKIEDEREYYFIRHKNKYFLQVIRRELELKANIQAVTHKGKLQYRLKVAGMDIAQLNRLGWQPRNAVQRGYPRLVAGHRDFIRAYMEIHSSVDTMTIRKQNRPPHKQPRLRIYGNKDFLAELTQVLANEVGTGPKKVQRATLESEVSGILYYMSKVELRNIFYYLYRPPVDYFDREYYGRYREVMRLFER